MLKSFLKLFTLLFIPFFLISCNDDDDNDSSDDDVNDRDAQALIDDADIIDFLQTYTYNYESFLTDETLTDLDVEFSIAEEGQQSFYDKLENTTTDASGGLIDALRKFEVEYEYDDGDGDETITQNLYVLYIREGAGETIYETSDVFNTYRAKVILTDDEDENGGKKLPEDYFAEAEIPDYLEIYGTITGFKEAFIKFKSGTPVGDSVDPCDTFYLNEEDGSLMTNNDFGIGIVFIPSGMAYFDTEYIVNDGYDDDGDGDIDEDTEDELSYEEEDFFGYRNLVYTFSTYNTFDVDYDEDGIPSHLEDYDGDGDVDNDDTDDDDIPDFLDSDDDDDGVATLLEIYLDDADNTIDSDCDGNTYNDFDGVNFVYLNESTGEVTYDSIDNYDPEGDDIPYHLDDDKDDYEEDEEDYEEANE